MKVDLHCHTNISDGSFTFDEILRQAKQQEVTHLAITNHDTTKGLEGMVAEGVKHGIEIIPGIEVSAFDFERNRRVHILGYFIEPGHTALTELCTPLLEKRHQASYEMVGKLNEAGYEIDWDRVVQLAEGGTGVYKQHIMQVLIEKGYTKTIYGRLYKKLFSRGGVDQEEPGIAFVPLEYVDAKSAIRAIREAGGIPVLAHPGQYKSFEAVPELVDAGLEGIEIWHPLHGREEEARAINYAMEFHLVMTGGSDFHGDYGEDDSIVLGCKDPGIDSVDALKKRKTSLLQKEV
ncbi:PHP domain-containing protein [Pseudalkalibacillus decolorationis]|uniref:PHP domain-containing protein n=1 Tax=Pseudalkalibacillus decolorationis TaxID=163879 RepID=UPI0021479C5D|nr:PHP domain-containing protein [Pseudalkalibacillus decolorationis]